MRPALWIDIINKCYYFSICYIYSICTHKNNKTFRSLSQQKLTEYFLQQFSLILWGKYGGWESSTRCNFRKHMQIEKAPANQENIFINRCCKCSQRNQIKKRMTNTHNTILFAVRFFIWLCCEPLCCKIDSYFLNLPFFVFLFAASWALSATVGKGENNQQNKAQLIFGNF